MTVLGIASFSLIAGQGMSIVSISCGIPLTTSSAIAFASTYLTTLPHTSLDAGIWVYTWIASKRSSPLRPPPLTTIRSLLVAVTLLNQLCAWIIGTRIRSRALLFLYKVCQDRITLLPTPNTLRCLVLLPGCPLYVLPQPRTSPACFLSDNHTKQYRPTGSSPAYNPSSNSSSSNSSPPSPSSSSIHSKSVAYGIAPCRSCSDQTRRTKNMCIRKPCRFM